MATKIVSAVDMIEGFGGREIGRMRRLHPHGRATRGLIQEVIASHYDNPLTPGAAYSYENR